MIKDILRIILYPIVLVRREYIKKKLQYLADHKSYKAIAEMQYKMRLGKKINWRNPQNINEKIQWLKFYSDTSSWTLCADKYRVRDFVKERGQEKLLTKLFGHWEDANKIEWDKLPNQFVLKVNHGSGDVLVCTDKNTIDKQEVIKKYNNLLKLKFGTLFAEPHYDEIQPCIIAEELLDKNKQSIKTDSLIDYKIWCFDGNPVYIWTCYNRTPKTVEVGTYDLNWNYHEEKSVFTKHYVKAKHLLPRPQSLDEMINASRILSKGFPEVRVDFYEVGGKPYFGEMTFTSKGGYMDFYTSQFLLELGNMIKLPISK